MYSAIHRACIPALDVPTSGLVSAALPGEGNVKLVGIGIGVQITLPKFGAGAMFIEPIVCQTIFPLVPLVSRRGVESRVFIKALDVL